MIKLSILIPVHTNHLGMFNELMEHLQKQITDEVEIISHIDSGEITTGEKRNLLLEQAKGVYIVTIDSDDWVPGYYIEEFLKAAETDCDCVAINGKMTTNGVKEIQWFLAKGNSNVTKFNNGVAFYERQTNHITMVKRELALKAKFPHKSNAEDRDYAIALNPHLKTETVISKPMYWYRFTTLNKLY